MIFTFSSMKGSRYQPKMSKNYLTICFSGIYIGRTEKYLWKSIFNLSTYSTIYKVISSNFSNVLGNSYLYFNTLLEKSVQQNGPGNVFRLQKNHATSTYSCRTCMLQVFSFKDHCHLWSQFYDLSTRKTQLFIVIQNGVHAFNPNCIHRTVEDNPLKVW